MVAITTCKDCGP